MLTFNQIVESVRESDASAADSLESAIKTEQAKVNKTDKLAVGMMLERIFRTQIDGAIKGKPVVLPGRFLHLDGVVRGAADVLRSKTAQGVSRKQKTGSVPNGPTAQPSEEERPVRGTGRMDLEDVMIGLDVAVRSDGYSIFIAQDRQKVLVTVMSSKQERMLAVTGEDFRSALADMMGKLLRGN